MLNYEVFIIEYILKPPLLKNVYYIGNQCMYVKIKGRHSTPSLNSFFKEIVVRNRNSEKNPSTCTLIRYSKRSNEY